MDPRAIGLGAIFGSIIFVSLLRGGYRPVLIIYAVVAAILVAIIGQRILNQKAAEAEQRKAAPEQDVVEEPEVSASSDNADAPVIGLQPSSEEEE